MNALVIVDLQKDFCEGGALPAKDGHKIVPVINTMLPQFDIVFATKDWHPENTTHFDKWPVHCVRNTPGAEFHQDLNMNKIDHVLLKGTGNSDDGYSAFEATNMDFLYELRRRSVSKLYVCGLTSEYCVKSTVIDALNKDIPVSLICNAIAPVEKNEGDESKAINEMAAAGAEILDSI